LPRAETYSLTDQTQRASRSVCANLAEAWRKRRYERASVSKLNEVESEAAETQVWLEFAHGCHCLRGEDRAGLFRSYDLVSGKVMNTINHSRQWVLHQDEMTNRDT